MCLCRREDARAVRVDKEGWSLLCVFKEQIEEEQQNVYVYVLTGGAVRTLHMNTFVRVSPLH